MEENKEIPQVPESGIPSNPVMPPDEKSIGPAIGIIIIIALMVLGGLYFWGQRLEMKENLEMQNAANEESMTPGADMNELETQSSSDETTSIEADLRATNFDGLGSEMNSVESEASAQ